METLHLFKKLPETKAEIEKTAGQIKSGLLNGEVDPLLFATQVSAMEKLFSSLKSDALIKDCILAEAEKYNQKSFDKGNANFRIQETGVTYEFSGCDDAEWNELTEKIKELTEKKKARETFLKSLTGEMTIYGKDGVQILPALKKSITSVVVTLK